MVEIHFSFDRLSEEVPVAYKSHLQRSAHHFVFYTALLCLDCNIFLRDNCTA